jgi:hypothetical protein
MLDYFGNERSTEWDVMEELQEESERIKEELPSLEDECAKLVA